MALPVRQSHTHKESGRRPTAVTIHARPDAMTIRLPSPMLARSGPIPNGDYVFELKWDGFRAIVARDDGLRVLSRRRTRRSSCPS